MKESAAFIAGAKQGVQAASAQKTAPPNSPVTFRENFFKDRVREGSGVLCGQFMDSLLIGGW